MELRETGSCFSSVRLDSMSNSCKQSKPCSSWQQQQRKVVVWVALMVQPHKQASAELWHWRGGMDTASRLRYTSIPGRGSSWIPGSVTLVGILGVYDFDVGEREEPSSSIHLTLPLTTDVHPCHCNNIANLGAERGQEDFLSEFQIYTHLCSSQKVSDTETVK